MKRLAAVFPLLLSFAGTLSTANAQSAALLTPDELIENWRTAKEFTLAVAEKMPEEDYFFKASPEEMTFAVLLMHIAGANVFRFEQLLGGKSTVDATVLRQHPKADVIRYLTASFDYVLQALPKLTAAQLAAMYKVDWVGRPQVTGRQLVLGMFTHVAHHRAQAEVYLRIKGIAPPAYRF